MKVYVIKKFETNTCGMYAWEPWKIVNTLDLACSEIKNDIIDKREVLNFEYKDNSKDLLTVNKVIPNHMCYSCSPGESDIVMIREWPLFTYIVSEIEVITK